MAAKAATRPMIAVPMHAKNAATTAPTVLMMATKRPVVRHLARYCRRKGRVAGWVLARAGITTTTIAHRSAARIVNIKAI